MFLDRHGHFFRTRTRHNVAVARRYLRGLAQAEDCTFESMAAVVEGGCPQLFQHFISCSPWDHEPVVAQSGQDADRLLGGKLRIPTKPATNSNRKPATDSDLKPAGIPI